ncbi:hypothetical protein [Beggiatoa leptomitoformis]|uniref:Uncharacterized protein n=1 Tax=Beggiatoa leptomitoformis TaxID=288004 RepID=A0A650GCX7_9GAMM|nr:hypothetical protein [Beggiatoa leptomitoformis]QGX03855.1 hypothetical protein AL038_19590 [Beggiatoa leptomitoformis]QGX04144.1 hypothetical protein BLE401_18790 [Beggiatoa leptomitoformis]
MTYSTDCRKLVMPIRQALLGGYLNAPCLSPLVLGKRSLVTSKRANCSIDALFLLIFYLIFL